MIKTTSCRLNIFEINYEKCPNIARAWRDFLKYASNGCLNSYVYYAHLQNNENYIENIIIILKSYKPK